MEPENVTSCQISREAGFRREGLLTRYLDLDGKRAKALLFSLLPGDMDPADRYSQPPCVSMSPVLGSSDHQAQKRRTYASNTAVAWASRLHRPSARGCPNNPTLVRGGHDLEVLLHGRRRRRLTCLVLRARGSD